MAEARSGDYVSAYPFFLRPNVQAGLVVLGPACSPTGNCPFGVYQLRAKKYKAILETIGVQTFAFLKTSTHGYPDLVTWSHASANWSVARLFRFNGKGYVVSGGWDEKSWYVDANGDVVNVDKVIITPLRMDELHQ